MKKWTPKEYAEYVNEDFINLLLSEEYETVLRIFSFDERDEYNRLLGEKIGTIPDDEDIEPPDDMGDPFLNDFFSLDGRRLLNT